MLDAKFKFEAGDKNYILDLKRDHNWGQSKRRLLIIQQTVPGYDLKAGELSSNEWLPNCVKYARQLARRVDPNIHEFTFATVNWNNRRHLHLKGPAKADAESEFQSRMLRLIKKLDPTHILFCGDLGVLYKVDVAVFKNGWVHKIDGRLVTSTLDFSKLVEVDGALANCLGFWCRHLANLILGYNPYQVNFEVKPKLVNTIKKFDRVMALFDDEKGGIAVDTETKSLSVLKNPIYTIQFAFESDPTKGYVIPIDHPHEDNPFTPEDRKYIKSELRKRFGKKHESGKYLLTFNGTFDLRIIRTNLKLPIIYLPVWEIMAGEHDLDENCSSLAAAGMRIGKMGAQGLAPVLCSYGNDFYFQKDTTFSKEDRASTGSISPSDEGFLLYGATDVVSLHFLRSAQLKRASHEELNGKSYRPYFITHMMNQMSDTVHQLSHLKESGSMIDRKYLKSLLRPDSKLVKAIDALMEEFKTFPEVRQANNELRSDAGFKAGSLFGGNKGTGAWVFSFTKAAHKVKLFFDVLGLKPVNKTATGADAVDKAFIATYKDRSFLVAKYGEYQEATKLMSTYVKGWYKRLTREIDGAIDSYLRADFTFHNVDTGRLASQNPNFQNITTRGKLAKIIKEMFVTEDGRLLIRFDYSAHEVRGWSIMSGDKVLASAFKAGQELRQRFIKAHPPHAKLKFPLTDDQVKEYTEKAKTSAKARSIMLTHEIAKELKTKGDIHIQNVFRFFKKWVDKSDPLRDAIKAVVFGVLYGKAAKTLGHDTKKAEIDAIRAKMSEVHNQISKEGSTPKLAKAMESLENDYHNLLEEDRTDYAQDIIDKMFTEFKRGKQWVDRMVELAQSKFYVYSPLGRMRRLYAVMLKDRRITSQQIRRGMNAPGQGFASEIAVKSSRLVMVSYYDDLRLLKEHLDLQGRFDLKFNRIVHDASYFSVPFEMVIPFLHILQYQSTYGIADLYEKEFGLKFTVEPEIEMEVGVRDTASHKWDWALPSLLQIIDKAVSQGCSEGMYTMPKAEIMATILAPWRNKKVLSYLNKTYPLLKVDLKDEITAAVSAYDEALEVAATEAKAAIKKAKSEAKTKERA